MENIIKKYTNGEVTVVWQPRKCIHSKICWEKTTGLPQVFNMDARPWINMEGASTSRIIEQVKKCPTEALTFYMNEVENTDCEDETGIEPEKEHECETIVQVMKNGPLMVYGNITVKDAGGNETKRKNVTPFCRCGASKAHPYCDGSHNDINFIG
jgi:uncharacterized Fe-S cluster protein YjdI